MKKKTELHPALSAMTTKEYDALWPKPPTPHGIRPLTPMVVCGRCERLKEENEALRAVLDAVWDVLDDMYSTYGTNPEIVVLLPVITAAKVQKLLEAARHARENGAID